MNCYLSNICVTLQCQVLVVWPQMEAVIMDAFMSTYSFLHQRNSHMLLKYHWTLVSEFQYSVNAFTCKAMEVWHVTLSAELSEQRCSCFLQREMTFDTYCWISLLCTVLLLWTALHGDINTHGFNTTKRCCSANPSFSSYKGNSICSYMEMPYVCRGVIHSMTIQSNVPLLQWKL